MEYLYSQSGVVLAEKEEDLSDMIVEGIEADSSSATYTEETGHYEDPLNQLITVESDETPQDEADVHVCLKQWMLP